MKLDVKKSLCLSVFFSILVSSAFADQAPAPVGSPIIPVIGKFYIAGFAGGGTSNEINGNQFGSAFFEEAVGGPLAVNAFGHFNTRSGWFAGGQVGFKSQNIMVDELWALVPAIELEGYYLGNVSYSGDLINDTTRLPEHDFDVSFNAKRTVFLTNFVLGLENPCYLIHPYVGLGFGAAIVKLSGADSLQIAPVELGVNHFNASTSDTDTTFAGQVKVGLSLDINQYVGFFAEYRWLYLADTHFIFGSTVYPTHAATSSWAVKLNSQRFNLGAAGIRFTF